MNRKEIFGDVKKDGFNALLIVFGIGIFWLVGYVAVGTEKFALAKVQASFWCSVGVVGLAFVLVLYDLVVVLTRWPYMQNQKVSLLCVDSPAR